MEEPEQTIMRTSLSRPQQLLGGDRRFTGRLNTQASSLPSERAMEEAEQTIMRTSLSRPQQLLGGDRS